MLPLTIVLTIRPIDGMPGIAGKMLGIFWRTASGAPSSIPIVWRLRRALSFGYVSLPDPVFAAVDMIAKAAVGTSLFALGLLLYGERFRVNTNVLTDVGGRANVGLQNFPQPTLMALGIVQFSLIGDPVRQVIVTRAVPTATDCGLDDCAF
jgi:malonate transporter